ncbi:MAG: hypothetical protein IPL59_16520 [Candidatus Competibacteraceae bacterium]|uniref:Uncharacterized protein n=1 Tax=Candidatus Contendobacter odensis Run_B_J11 TaxID=1400861 RepID=A0A7U7GFM0_9GAMM|nr:hypothetical protein [Candidatus Contendobacter odensis]MBK8536586.1 hypothetical protein [Candidatus Competibacteraceae bacterium]MBK8753136.1 hypothetical protein [Candidatus Competibacteraceae bacterium]CDH47519.1 exported hypothetical protein [Candidatus Contendobacter odensis Run_B_J11]
MLKKQRFAATLLVIGLTAGLAGWTTVQAADPAPPVAKPTASPPAQAADSTKKEWLLPTGEHWVKGTETEKRAYILGILNMAMIEYQLAGPRPKHRTTVVNLVKSLDGMTVPQIVELVDGYYKASPDHQQRPVVEVIWFELVVPKTKKG